MNYKPIMTRIYLMEDFFFLIFVSLHERASVYTGAIFRLIIAADTGFSPINHLTSFLSIARLRAMFIKC